MTRLSTKALLIVAADPLTAQEAGSDAAARGSDQRLDLTKLSIFFHGSTVAELRFSVRSPP